MENLTSQIDGALQSIPTILQKIPNIKSCRLFKLYRFKAWNRTRTKVFCVESEVIGATRVASRRLALKELGAQH